MSGRLDRPGTESTMNAVDSAHTVWITNYAVGCGRNVEGGVFRSRGAECAIR